MKIESKVAISVVVVAAAQQVASTYRCSGIPHTDAIGDAFEQFAKLIADLADKSSDE